MRPIVLSHGLGDDAGTWAEVEPDAGSAPRGHHVEPARPWQRRRADAAAPGDFTPESAIGDLLDVIGDAGPPVHLVGHSLGGFLSMAVALRRPDLVCSLALIVVGARLSRPERSRAVESIRRSRGAAHAGARGSRWDLRIKRAVRSSTAPRGCSHHCS